MPYVLPYFYITVNLFGAGQVICSAKPLRLKDLLRALPVCVHMLLHDTALFKTYVSFVPTGPLIFGRLADMCHRHWSSFCWSYEQNHPDTCRIT